MTLKNLKRKYRVQIILSYIPLIVTLIISYLNSLPKDFINYKILLIIIFLVVPLFYSYILLLKNHIEELESKNSELISSQSHTMQYVERETEKLEPSEIHHRLNSLSEKEKELLRRYIQEDTRTLRLRYDNSVADGLRSIGIIDVSSVVSTMGKFSYSIRPIYWEYIKKRPDVIGL